MSTIKRYGLIGHPLTHSFSKKYFTEKFEREQIPNCVYELFDLSEINELPGVLEKYPNLQGLNVTIPYKQQVFSFLDEIDEKAKRIGAVNVIKIENGKLKGYNSDYYGFQNALTKWVGNNKIHQALILGTGGASKAIKCALEDLNISVQSVSRSAGQEAISYSSLNDVSFDINEYPLIVNCTPLGTYPHTDTCPDIPYQKLSAKHFLFDLVYNPEVTLFMQKGIDRQAQVKNGYEMLVLQAEKSWEIWNA